MSEVKNFISKWIFAYAYPIAFVGAFLLGVTETVGYNPSSVINEKALMAVNVVIGVAGAISLFNWFDSDVPFVGSMIVDRKEIKSKN